MFGDKENINILTALLVDHGVKRAVVCPGSRNAPIIHNLNECEEITCYPVTDERSAAFYALGMSLADNAPTVVCVTSGTALLNLAPAVAEASYRHHGLIVISADRPAPWIDQLDGQTLPQYNALGHFVGKCVNLPEPTNDTERWYCNRLVNEALLSVTAHGRKSVHINVPISEPLFDFRTETITHQRVIRSVSSSLDIEAFRRLVSHMLSTAKRPMLLVGQICERMDEVEKALKIIERSIAVLAEPLSSGGQRLFDLTLAVHGDEDGLAPDFLLCVGDTLVSKRAKAFLRNNDIAETWLVSEDGNVYDTFMQLTGVFEGNPVEAILSLADIVNDDVIDCRHAQQYATMWNARMCEIARQMVEIEPSYSQLAAVREFEISLEDMDYAFNVHYANSNAVRLACIYSGHYVWCNRGVNGIEGSLSVAAGFSVVSDSMVFCVIGDLSFFYDQNALWNTNIGGNFRILLLNNGCGGIFYSLRGLDESKAFDRLVAGHHNTTAKGICEQNDVGYLSACNMDELRLGMASFMTVNTKRPLLFEVFTDAVKDKEAIKYFMHELKNNKIKK